MEGGAGPDGRFTVSPIKWVVSASDDDPEVAARRMAAESPGDGMVVVQKQDGAAVLRLSAVVRTSGVSRLALTLIAAFSASEGIRKDTGVISWVRWPDKVVIGEAVVATTDVSLLPRGGEPRAALNFAVNRLHLEGEGVTSLQDQLGVEVDEGILVGKMLESLSWMHFGWTNDMKEHVLKRVKSMTETLDRPVSVRTGSAHGRGTATEIDRLGRLVVRLERGGVAKLSSADELLSW